MRRAFRILASIAFVAAGTASSDAQTNPWDVLVGFPAYITMQTYHLPVAANILGKRFVFYEVYVLNAYGSDIDVTALTVRAGGKKVAIFSGSALASMIRPIGRVAAAPSRRIAAAETAVLYVALPFAAPHAIPQSLENRLTLTVSGVGPHIFTVAQAPLRTNQKPPIVIAPPLHGDGWFAGSGPSNVSDHRRATFYLNGRPYLGQRFAIDWLQGHADGHGRLAFFHGDSKNNANWYCWNRPVYAVADGVVAGERMDLPENIPSQPPAVRVTQDTIGGNYLVLGIGFGRFAFYAHLRPNSATVKVGDHVKTGEPIARLGNSGNSTAPHLHFHVTDAPQFIFADGEPYAFATLRAAASTWNDARPADGASLSSPFHTYRAAMPGDRSVVDFGPR